MIVVGGVFDSNGAIRSDLLLTTDQLEAAGFVPQDSMTW
jgi:hypothetical protein